MRFFCHIDDWRRRTFIGSDLYEHAERGMIQVVKLLETHFAALIELNDARGTEFRLEWCLRLRRVTQDSGQNRQFPLRGAGWRRAELRQPQVCLQRHAVPRAADMDNDAAFQFRAFPELPSSPHANGRCGTAPLQRLTPRIVVDDAMRW